MSLTKCVDFSSQVTSSRAFFVIPRSVMPLAATLKTKNKTKQNKNKRKKIDACAPVAPPRLYNLFEI